MDTKVLKTILVCSVLGGLAVPVANWLHPLKPLPSATSTITQATPAVPPDGTPNYKRDDGNYDWNWRSYLEQQPRVQVVPNYRYPATRYQNLHTGFYAIVGDENATCERSWSYVWLNNGRDSRNNWLDLPQGMKVEILSRTAGPQSAVWDDIFKDSVVIRMPSGTVCWANTIELNP
jgi:hypothetical protein